MFDNTILLKIENLKKIQMIAYSQKLKSFFEHMKNLKVCEQEEMVFYEKIKSLVQKAIEVEGRRNLTSGISWSF